MPEMSGPPLFDTVTRDDNGVRMLYTSGYTDDAIVQHGVLKPGIDLIHQPFSPTQLLVKAREVLDRPREQQAP